MSRIKRAPRRNCRAHRKLTGHAQRGFGLVEAMIAFLLLGIGLFATMKMIAVSKVQTDGASAHVNATFLGRYIIESMRANIDAVDANNYDTGLDDTVLVSPDCSSGGCSASQIAEVDLFIWKRAVSSTLGSGQASISAAGDVISVTINWLDRGVQESKSMSFTL